MVTPSRMAFLKLEASEKPPFVVLEAASADSIGARLVPAIMTLPLLLS